MSKKYKDVEALAEIASSEVDEENDVVVESEPADDMSVDEVDDDDSRTNAQKAIEALRDDDEESTSVTLKAVLGGDIFSVSWLRRNLPFFILIMIMLVLYITNRYAAQKEMIRIDNLKKELSDARNRATSRSSQLLQLSRESKVVEFLKHTPDSALNVASQPPFTIVNDLQTAE
jgi:hypothetical protein